MGDTMERTEAPDEFGGIDTDDAAIWEEFLEDCEGLWVFRALVGWDEDDLIGDIEVSVTGWEALAVVFDPARHGKFDDAEGIAVQVAEGSEPSEILLEQLIVLVRGIGFDDGDDGLGVGEAGEIVDMPVRVIPDDSFAEPKDLGHTEVIAEVLLNLRFGEMRISIGIKEASFGGEEGTASIDLDGAAFHDDAGRKERESAKSGDVLGEGVVEIEWRIFAPPRIVSPIDDGAFMISGDIADEKDGAVIAAPGFISGEMMKLNSIEWRAKAEEEVSHGGFGLGIPDVDMDRLDLGEVLDELAIDRWNGVEFIRETNSVGTRPGEPSASVGFPFGRHAKTKLSG